MDIEQTVFILLFIFTGWLAYRFYAQVVRSIRLGKAWKPEGPSAARWKHVLLVAFGQKKMFTRPLIALFHAFIYVAFLFTQIELIEILLDGILGTHRLFAHSLGLLYTVVINLIEVLSVLAFMATIIFLWRRNLLRLARFEKPEMSGWPKRDANLILLGEIVLIVGIFTMNGADVLLQQIDPQHYPETGTLLISDWLGPILFGQMDVATLHILERVGWWLHVVTVFGFLLYLPVSKHLHILLAFPNTYYGRLTPNGKMSNMPAVMHEVQSMLGIGETSGGEDVDGEIPEFGAKDVTDLTWKQLLEAYTCTECGRCTAVCPANLTGKKLSPRKIMMDVRDRAEEVGKKIATGDARYLSKERQDEVLSSDNFDDGASLFDRISSEELHACTSCNACVEACPVLINPLDIILEMRRYEVLTLGTGPGDWMPMFTSLENSGAVWQVNQDRDKWIEELNQQ